MVTLVECIALGAPSDSNLIFFTQTHCRRLVHFVEPKQLDDAAIPWRNIDLITPWRYSEWRPKFTWKTKIMTSVCGGIPPYETPIPAIVDIILIGITDYESLDEVYDVI